VIGAQGDGQLVNYRFRRRTTSWIGCSARPNCAWAGTRATWCGSSARTAWRGGTDHEPGRHPRPCHAAGGQGRARGGGAARPAAPGHAPEPAHAGHPCRRPVGRRARGHDLVAATAAAQRRRTDRALQRRSRLEVRRAGRPAGRLLEAAAEGARAGAAAAGRPWPGHRELAAAGDADYTRRRATTRTMPCARRPKRLRLRRCSSARARQGKPPRRGAASRCGWPASRLGGLRPTRGRAGLDGGAACRPDRRAEPARPERGVPERRLYGNPQFRQSANAGLALSGDGRHGDRRRAGDRHQVGLAGRRDRHGDGAGL
jgi:hypothetical protein